METLANIMFFLSITGITVAAARARVLERRARAAAAKAERIEKLRGLAPTHPVFRNR